MKVFIFCFLFCTQIFAQETINTFDYLDVFSLEYVADPQISPDSKHILYARNSFDIMMDRKISRIWRMDNDGLNHRKLTNLDVNESQARWSPSGDRIAFVASTDQGSEIFVYWVKTGNYARISQLEFSPSSISWSPDGDFIAFRMFVSSSAPLIVSGPKMPKGAKWASSPRITTRLKHEANGQGYIKDGFSHLFVIDAQGGHPIQLTNGDFHSSGNLSWSKDSDRICFSSNRNPNWEYEYNDSNIYSVSVKTKKITQLSANNGPEYSPIVSPDGKKIAFLGYVDRVQTYQVVKLYVMNIDGTNKEVWMDDLDRSISDIQWKSDSKSVYYSYTNNGNTKIAKVSNGGIRQDLAKNVGGTTLGRPYPSGSFHVSSKNEIVYSYSTPYHPAELAFLSKRDKKITLLTSLNSDLFKSKKLGEVKAVSYKSTVDGRNIHGWIIFPPHYDSSKKYPLLVENHGGPILDYGDRFTAELQLYAAKGYLVFYPNPRGSTSYGEEFGNLLYNNYPGDDYQDVMDGVDYLIKEKYTTEDQLFVTGGSAGGIMTAWMIGKSNRFKAAVVHKPVINWISKTLVADNYFQYAEYRYPGQPWENFETYWKFSPISLVGNVETPTMVMVGMNDLRTPPSEAKQFYHALKIRKIETVLVEIPGASHGIANRPSQLITKVAHTVAWLDKYRE